MDIHVVTAGESLYSIARAYGVSLARLMADNQLPDPNALAVGQTVVVRYPERVYTVLPGDTLAAVARKTGVSLRTLWQNNPELRGESSIYPGHT